MTTNARNYKKHPHTARFLQTFHSGISSTGRNYRAETATEPEADEERTAMAFIGATGQAANTEIFVKGWRILTGPGLVSEAQAKWIVDIAETRDGVTDAMVKSLAERLIQGFPRSAASAFINKYKDLPKRPAFFGADEPNRNAETAASNETPKEGRYAVEHEGVLKFYRVTKGKGRWEGRTFLEVQASDDRHPIRSAVSKAQIFALIMANPLAAAQRYGQELGSCSRCGRTLTDETSRAYGIGPDCRSKM